MVTQMRPIFLSLVFAAAASGATLEKLTLDDMTAKATEIVRAKVGACAAGFRGKLIYTTCRLEVIERWKGADRATVSVSLPGGAAGGVRQTFAGTPTLATGREHVFFLWSGRSGVTQLIGLSQGLLGLERTSAGEWLAVRAPITERMLDAEGKPARDEGIDIPLADLRKRVTGVGK
jgi:hypothetical protein